jgi:hypothetical protein
MPATLSNSAANVISKTPGESIYYGWDFTKRLAESGETISSVTSVTCTAASGTGAVVGDLTIGSAAVNSGGTFPNDAGATVATSKGVQARISGGIDGATYTVRCRVATSAGNTRDLLCTLQVRDS